jgi:hypothetical protein
MEGSCCDHTAKLTQRKDMVSRDLMGTPFINIKKTAVSMASGEWEKIFYSFNALPTNGSLLLF